MRQQVLLFKLLGSGWLMLGLVCLALVSLLVSGQGWSERIAQMLSGDAGALWNAFYCPVIAVTLPVWGLVCIVLGWNLIRLASWAQLLVQTVHLLLAVYLVVALMVSFAVAPEARGGLALGVMLLAGNLGLTYLLRGRLAGEVFSHLPLRTAPVVPRRCEFCGGSLELQTGRCPECEPAIRLNQRAAAQERPKPALAAQLASSDDGATYLLSSLGATFVGRELERNDINLNNPTVSRRHARVEYDVQNSRYVLMAMQDVNGTFVNDKLVRQRNLRDGDEVRFGRARFRFTIVTGVESAGG